VFLAILLELKTRQTDSSSHNIEQVSVVEN